MTAFDQVLAGCRVTLFESAPIVAIDDDAWALATRHRVLPLLPEQPQPARSSQLRSITHRQLAHVSELRRIADQLQGQIDWIALKGPALAVQLYGNLAARDSLDLDLLVRPQDVPRALAALRDLGYIGQILQGNTFRHHVRTQHELALLHSSSHPLLELQWAWAQRHYAVDRSIEECLRKAVTVSVAGRAMKVLSAEDTVLYLAVHGAKHGWSQLSLCTDFAAAALRLRPDWETVNGVAARAGLKRILAVAAELSRLMFAVAAPVEIDRVARALALEIAGQLKRGALPSASIANFARQRERSADRARVIARAAITPTPSDTSWLELRDGWFPLYYLIRPLRLCLRPFIPGMRHAASAASARAMLAL